MTGEAARISIKLANGQTASSTLTANRQPQSYPSAPVGLCDDVRASCAAIAENAEWVRIHLDAAEEIEPGPAPALDPERHYLEGTRAEVCTYLLTLDAINFGSGWFPTLRKRPGASGYYTVAWALADHFRAHGPWSPEELELLDGRRVAAVLEQESGHELMELYAEALRDLGRFLSGRSALELVNAAKGSAEALAEMLSRGMPFFDDRGFYKRAQIVPSNLALAGVADFWDLNGLTIFADNLVPHVLRVDGVLSYDAELSGRIDREELIPPGDEEREIRACALHACEAIAARLGVPPRILDIWLWNRGQEPRYKALPRHRTRTVFY